MKNLFKMFPIAAVAVSSFFFMGCPSDPCVSKKIECGTNGTCLEGLCNCSDGYEGDKCETESRTKMLYATYNIAGTYAVDSCARGTNSTIPYNTGGVSAVSAGAKDNEIKISNFAKSGAGIFVVATVKGNTITVAKQTVGGSEFTGAGTFNATTKALSYTYTQKSTGQICTRGGTATGEHVETGSASLTR